MPKPRPVSEPVDIASLLAGLQGTVSGNTRPLVSGTALPAMMEAAGGPMSGKTAIPVSEFGGGGGGGSSSAPGDVRQRLKTGFMRAGRKDLADFVDTPDFDVWIKKESGWNPDVESPRNNQGKSNYGLFQFWRGHSWLPPKMSVEDQAYAAATKFKLDPNKIRGYASQIRGGGYKGWG